MLVKLRLNAPPWGRFCQNNTLARPPASQPRAMGLCAPSFDSLGHAVLPLLSTVLLDGWAERMRDTMAAASAHAWAYYVLLAVCGGLLLTALLARAGAGGAVGDHICRDPQTPPLMACADCSMEIV